MRLEYTNGQNPDFVKLCHDLDDYLNELAGGEENRAHYIPYNQLNDIHDALVAYANTQPIGCVSFKAYNNQCAEVKRFYIDTAYRGKGVSNLLMDALEDIAQKQGYRYLILETIPSLGAAMAFYKKYGYEIIPNYGQYKDIPDSVCMKKALE